MSDEILKVASNGQWSLEKAKIIDIKSKKTLADLPTTHQSNEGKGIVFHGGPTPQIVPTKPKNVKNVYRQNPEPSSEKPKKLAKALDNGQWTMDETLEKMAVPGIKSNHIFSMDHIKQVAEAPSHDHAKKIAHEAIRSSGAHEHNKGKASLMVNQSKSASHLAQGMTNFHMARDAKVRRRLGGQQD